jgi:hypothetical protein
MNGAGERTLPAGERIDFALTIDASGVRADSICRVVETLINRLKRWRGLATRCDKSPSPTRPHSTSPPSSSGHDAN